MSAWTQKASKGGDANFEKAPAGNHPAVLVAIVDMGTQENNYQGNVTWQHRAYFVYELVQEKNQAGRNFLMAIDLTVSLNEKAKLRRWIEARTGKQIPDGVEYDISQEIGQPVLLNVVMKGDYPKIESVGSVPKGMVVPPPQNTPVIIGLDAIKGGAKLPDWLPWLYGEKIEDHISRCQEFTGKGTGGAAPPPPPAANGMAPPPPPPNGSDPELYWLHLDGKVIDQPVSLTDAGHLLFQKGLKPEDVKACKHGTQEWKAAETFGIKHPF